MGIELLRVDLGRDDSDWLIAQVRAALAQADPLDHLAVLHLATPDRRASSLRARVFEGSYGVHYPAGSPERVARQLLNEFEPALRLRTDVERDFDFFAALNETLDELGDRRRAGRPLVDELQTAWKRIAQALPPEQRTADRLADWVEPLGERVRVLLGVVERYRSRLAETRCADPEDALWIAAAKLPSWDVSPRMVIADDLDRVSPARQAFLKALAAKAQRAMFILRGRRDQLPFLQQPHDAHQEFVLGTGGKVIPELELPATTRIDLLEAWAADGSANRDIDIVCPYTRAAEVRQAAQFVRRALNDGVPASELCVAMPATGPYAELIEETFTAAGIPYDAPFETPLDRATPVAAVLDLLAAARDGLERAGVVDALASPYLPFGAGDAEERVRRLVKATRDGWVVGGRDLKRDWLDRLDSQLSTSNLKWVSGVLNLLAPFARGHGRSADLVDGALAIVEASGVRTVVEADARGGDAGAAARAMAMHGFTRLLREMGAEFRRVGNPSLRVAELLRAVSEQAGTRSIRPPRASGERVRVLGLRELRGVRFKHVMILGLTDADLPLADEASMFFPESRQDALAGVVGGAMAAEICAPIDTARQADYLFAHALLSASGRLILSMPRAAGDTPFVPALPFARLLRCVGVDAEPLPAALATDAPTSAHDLARVAAVELARAESGLAAAQSLPVSDALSVGLRSRCIELARTDLTAPPGEYDGAVGALPELPTRFGPDAGETRQVFSPSQLDNYVECPMRFWSRYVIGAKPADEPTLDTPPHMVGILLHRAFERYVLLLRAEAGQPEVLDDPLKRKPVHLLDAAADDGAAMQLGHRLIRAAFEHACEVEKTEGPFWEGVKRQVLAGLPGEPDTGLGRGLLARFVDEELDRAKQGIGARFVEFDFGKDNTPKPHAPDAVPAPIDLPLEEGFIRLMGSVDRVDEGPDGLEIVDYKTGGAKTTAEVRDGKAFQLATYLAAISRLAGNQPRGMSYLLAPTQKKLDRKEVWKQRGKPAFDVGQLVNEVLPRRLSRVMGALSAGVFSHLPFANPGAPCRYCDYASACARRDDVIEERQHRNDNPGAYLPDEEARP